MTANSDAMRRRGTLAVGVTTLLIAAAALWWTGRLGGTGGTPMAIDASGLQITAAFAPDPPHPGTNTLTLTIRDQTGQPVEGVAVRGTATMGAMGSMPEMKAAGVVEEQGDGVYRLEFDLATHGSWPLSLHLHAPEGRDAELEFAYATGIPVRVTSSAGDESAAAAAGVSHYTCSMHPSVRASAPGQCPICAMDLVPVMAEEVTSGVIRVDNARRQLIGVKTGRVERKPLTLTVRAVGAITYDETRLTDVSLKYRGWIGEVFADSMGIAVEAGQPLFTIYAPELLSAQQEYLESLRRGRGGAPSPLLAVAKRRLRLWDLTEAQIGSLTAAGQVREYLPILSPASGTVIEKNIVAGSAAEAGMRLYRIADLSTVWIDAEIYEADLPLVTAGQQATVILSYLPGEQRTGTIAYVYPYLDTPTRTGRVRLALSNPDGALRPGMYATVEVAVPHGEQLIVPEDAVVMAGKTNVVFLDLGEGRLKPRRVTIGRKGADGYVVLDGLDEGDAVVTSGTFLIAAESKLKSGAKQW
jgi:Cu(I)/Ag(I) efflux system membrane fusion protein